MLSTVMLCMFLLSGCAGSASMFQPSGRAAQEIWNLWWLLLSIGTAVFLFVVVVLAVALFRRRQRPLPEWLQRWAGERFVVLAGIVMPAVLLLTVFGFTVRTLGVLSSPDRPVELVIHVVAHQWWWEVRYPQYGFVTANEIHIPANQPVQFVLSSDDVIHSFWVPQLHGKLDTVPGQTNQFWLQADEPGIYIGECAEFCGIQHANMRFLVVAEAQPQFLAWAAAQQQPAREPADSLALAGQQLFLGSTCIQCHAIAGTHATGRLGPDLTHLASRRTLASAALPNNRGNLAGWISDPQHIKPGSYMPATSLTGSDLQALLAYLATLE